VKDVLLTWSFLDDICLNRAEKNYASSAEREALMLESFRREKVSCCFQRYSYDEVKVCMSHTCLVMVMRIKNGINML